MTKATGIGSVAMFVLVLSFLAVTTVSANHSWGGYHWARTANPFTVKLGNNLTSNWQSYLNTAAADWSVSNALDATIVSGSAFPKTCKPSAGKVEVCNARYGSNGWLGLASIWISDGQHISQGTVKMNDTYFSTATYNTPAWKNLVLCQEVGHTFGLDHQDENFNNAPLGTCMDYTNDPTPNQHPNAHDYEQLNTIYSHLDSFTTLSASIASTPSLAVKQEDEITEDPSSWGKEIRTSEDKRASVFEKELGDGRKVITHVYWVDRIVAKNN